MGHHLKAKERPPTILVVGTAQLEQVLAVPHICVEAGAAAAVIGGVATTGAGAAAGTGAAAAADGGAAETVAVATVAWGCVVWVGHHFQPVPLATQAHKPFMVAGCGCKPC